MRKIRYALFHEIWGYCVHVDYPAQWLLHIDGAEALLFDTRREARKAASKWAQGHMHVIRVTLRKKGN